MGKALAMAALAVVLATGAARAQDTNGEVNDPFEDFNRAIFDFNQGFDRFLLRPLAEGYEFVFPEPTRDMIKHFLDNLRTPIILANDLLQGKLGRAGQTVHRFLFNTTFGFGGLFDVVGGNIPGSPGGGAGTVAFHDEDFGQTLAVWGLGEGPYLVLPFLGPAPPRDAVGLGVDTFFDPLTYANISIFYNVARTGTRAVDTRSRHLESLDEIEETSIDFYATIRSLYRQRRNDEIRDGAPPETIPIPAISFNFEEDEGEESVSLLPGD
jgi:phospholipid-binding lipoprotein MlaA